MFVARQLNMGMNSNHSTERRIQIQERASRKHDWDVHAKLKHKRQVQEKDKVARNDVTTFS